MESQDFENYLKRKKIDPQSFREKDPDLWEDYKYDFERMHPESFTAQKLFKLNRLRRMYTYTGAVPETVSPAAPAMKPKISMKPKIK